MLSRIDELKLLLKKYYEDYQISGKAILVNLTNDSSNLQICFELNFHNLDLIQIYTEKVYKKGTVIKGKHEPFDKVFMIETGTMGLYVYSYGSK